MQRRNRSLYGSLTHRHRYATPLRPPPARPRWYPATSSHTEQSVRSLAGTNPIAKNREFVRHIPRKAEEILLENAAQIEKRIAELRELLRCTLDRTALPRIREQLMQQIAKLKELGGTSPVEKPTR